MPNVRLRRLFYGLVIIIGACSQSSVPEAARNEQIRAANLRPVVAASSGESVLQAPWLRTVLPADAFAYIRILNPWGLLGIPNGTAFDRATGSKAYTDSIASIRSGMVQTLFPEIGDDLNPLWRLLLAHSRSPMELALLPSAVASTQDKPMVMMPEFLFGLVLDLKTVDEVNDLLQGIAATNPQLQITSPFNPKGHAMITVAGLSGYLKYDVTNRRLLGLLEFKNAGGPGPSADRETQLNSLKKVVDHPMYRIEKQLDAGGHGVFFWLDPKPILAMQNSPFAGPIAALSAMGGQAVNDIGFGIGSAGGKQRIGLLLDMQATGIRSLIPLANIKTNLRAAGDIHGVVLFGVPSVDDLKRFETQAAMMVGSESLQEYLDVKKSLQSKLGFSIEDVLSVIGPESVLLFDDSGAYFAVRVQNPQAFDQLIQKLRKQTNLTYSEKTVAKQTYSHLIIPAMSTMQEDQQAGSANPEPEPEPEPEPGYMRLLERIINLPSHLYWVKEGDYVLLSNTPQGLMDRQSMAAGKEIGDWLKNTQKLNVDHSLLLASGRKHGLPRMMYDFNLQMLVALGDLVDRPVDLFAFPSALEAGLPEYGGFSFKLDSSESRLGLELSYDNNPGELFFAGGAMTGVAMMGIMSAIAIPAYHDYKVRAELTAGMVAVTPLRERITEFYKKTTRMPTAKEAKELLISPNSDAIEGWEYDEENGSLIITFAEDSLGEDNVLVLVPSIQDGQLSWECSSSIAYKNLPAMCK